MLVRWLLICSLLVALFAPHQAAAQSLECDISVASQAILQLLKPGAESLFYYLNQRTVTIDGLPIKLQVCAPKSADGDALRMLLLLERALPVLSVHAAAPLRDSLTRQIVLVDSQQLLARNLDGMMYPGSDIIYLHPQSQDWTVIHEAAHYWADADLFGEPWMVEGFADYLTLRTASDLQIPFTSQLPPAECAQQPLLRWDPTDYQLARCAYDVGSAVFADLAAAVGDEVFRAAIREVDQYHGGVTTWGLLVTLERLSGQDLTDIVKQAVYPQEYWPALELRQQQWVELRALSVSAERLGIRLPPELGSYLDLGEDRRSELQALSELTSQAEQVALRCQELPLPCTQPWRELPDEIATWQQVSEQLIQARPQLETYAAIFDALKPFGLLPTAAQVASAASLNPDQAASLASALALVQRAQALEQRCELLELQCSQAWRDAWIAADLLHVTELLSQYEQLVERAEAVEQRCNSISLADACRSAWAAAYFRAAVPAALLELEQLDQLLSDAQALEVDCQGAGWPCDQAWRSIFRNNGAGALHSYINTTRAALPELRSLPLAPATAANPYEWLVNEIAAWLEHPWHSESFTELTAQARSSFAAGDTERALSLARSATQRRAEGETFRRIIRIGLVLVLVVIVGVLIAWLRYLHRRTRKQPALRPEELLAHLLTQPPERS